MGHRLVVTGGYGLNNRDLSSVEVYVPGGGWQMAGWRLSQPDYGHCAVAVDDFHLLIVSGAGNEPRMSVDIVNIETGAKKAVAQPPRARGGRHFCAADEKNVYVVDKSKQHQYQIHKYSLESGEWDTPGTVPSLRMEAAVGGLVVLSGVLTLFDQGQNVYVLQGNQWLMGHQTRGRLSKGTVVKLS